MIGQQERRHFLQSIPLGDSRITSHRRLDRGNIRINPK
jgi:hypothetical protein